MAGYTQDDLNALERALALGTLRVRDGDRDITYRSVVELREAINTVRASLSGGRRSHFQPTFERGV